jgi:hypothetical protein
MHDGNHVVLVYLAPHRARSKLSSLFCCNIDYNYSLIEVAPIAQLDRALVFGTSGWEFESLWAHFLFNLAPTFTSKTDFTREIAQCLLLHPI